VHATLGGLSKASLEAHHFLPVEPGKSQKHCFTPWRQRDKYIPPIVRIVHFADQPASLSSTHKSHNRVMARLQELSQFGNGGFVVIRIACDAQQQLMLQWCDAAIPRRLFTEAQEFAQSVTKPCKMAHYFLKSGGISVCQKLIRRRSRSHKSRIVSQYDMQR
jgi:hypothetical protein